MFPQTIPNAGTLVWYHKLTMLVPCLSSTAGRDIVGAELRTSKSIAPQGKVRELFSGMLLGSSVEWKARSKRVELQWARLPIQRPTEKDGGRGRQESNWLQGALGGRQAGAPQREGWVLCSYLVGFEGRSPEL